MLIVVQAKQEYEAVEMVKKTKEYLDFIKNSGTKNNNFIDTNLTSKFTDVNLSENIIELATAGNLFGEKQIYFVKVLLQESLDLFTKEVSKMCIQSENLFIFYGKTKLFTDKCNEYKIKLLEKKEVYKVNFPTDLVNALQKKDKKNSWILYRKEIENKNIEEVYGLMVWAYKQALMVAAMDKFDEKSGIKEFAYKNTRRNIEGRKDLEQTYFELVNLYANSRNRSLDLSSELERWILG
jgi:hypothetical protein